MLRLGSPKWRRWVSPTLRWYHATGSLQAKKGVCPSEPPPVAIVLCGCGALDGTEISEAMSLIYHCCGKSLRPCFYAPQVDICGVMNHLTMEPDTCGVPRNAMVESARLARSNLRPLCDCKACNAEALFIPGGFGVAKTLSDFATKGSECVVQPDLKNAIEDFACSRKPIAAMCIASAIAARVLKGAKVTLGKDKPPELWPYADAIAQVQKMGACVELKDVKGVTYCTKHNLFTTPAWLYAAATYSEIHQGIGNLVCAVAQAIK
ncbi:ES1 protein homolog, mitochondrial [Orussus abietinus]|uniref:ES1 protein homolog, mitochondrial n=1 Tax=Orussus abietinus TaxID=222816 RepID=UPI000625D595|nr:ES1 protein homolog, mitochondrial [Orussus abietinus]